MNVDLISFLVGVLSSLIAAISVYWVKKVAKNITKETKVILKNDKGEIREVEANTNDSKNDYRSYIHEAIAYEKFVAETLDKLNLNVEVTSNHSMDKGYDFLIKNDEHYIAIEVKSYKRPLPTKVIRDTLSKLPKEIKNVFFVSKSGFSNSSIDNINDTERSVSLIDGDNEELYKNISEALGKQGITSK